MSSQEAILEYSKLHLNEIEMSIGRMLLDVADETRGAGFEDIYQAIKTARSYFQTTIIDNASFLCSELRKVNLEGRLANSLEGIALIAEVIDRSGIDTHGVNVLLLAVWMYKVGLNTVCPDHA